MPKSMSLFIEAPPRRLAVPAPVIKEDSAPAPKPAKKARAPSQEQKPCPRRGCAMNSEPEKPVNLLWAIDEIIIMLQQLRERIRRMAREGALCRPSPGGSRARDFRETARGLRHWLPSSYRALGREQSADGKRA